MTMRMAALANSFACHLGGGGGTSTTSSEIPEEWKPYYTQVVQNALGAMGKLPLFSSATQGDGGGGGGDGGGTRDPRTPAIQNQDKSSNYKGPALDPGKYGDGTMRIRRPTGRVTPIPRDGSQPVGTPAGQSWWVPEGSDTTWRPDQGAYSWNPAQVAGPSALENKAAAGAAYAGEQSEAYKQAGNAFSGGRGSIANMNLKDMPALQEAFSIFEESIRPSVLNQAALTGQDAGTAENVALAKAKASYMMPTIFKGLDLAESAKHRDLAAGQGFAGLAGQEDARRFGAIEAQNRIGKEGRAITQAEMDAQERERQRLISASERINLGPLASLLPAVMGSSTTTSQNKF